MKSTLKVLPTGLGTRYGGLKQLNIDFIYKPKDLNCLTYKDETWKN